MDGNIFISYFGGSNNIFVDCISNSLIFGHIVIFYFNSVLLIGVLLRGKAYYEVCKSYHKSQDTYDPNAGFFKVRINAETLGRFQFLVFLDLNFENLYNRRFTLDHTFLSHLFLLRNTFIYVSILIKFYMNDIIMNKQIFYLNMYDLKGHWRSSYSSYFSVNPTLPLLDGPLMLPLQIVWISLSLCFSFSLLKFPSYYS